MTTNSEQPEQSFYRDKKGKLMCSGCNTEVFGGLCECTDYEKLNAMNSEPVDKLETFMPRCKTKDTHDYPELLDDKTGRCWNCQVWELIDQRVTKAQEEYWLKGYEAGMAVSSGELKGISLAEAKKQLNKGVDK